jgi:hypothetical protein
MKDDAAPSPPIDRRHRRALARAAQDLHVAARPLKGTGRPEFDALKAAAGLFSRGGIDVVGAKRAACDLVPPPNLAGVLSIVNLHAKREGLDPFEGFLRNSTD